MIHNIKFYTAGFIALAVLISCAAKQQDLADVVRPAGTTPYQGDKTELLAYGEKLWNDPTIGNSSLACGTCHAGNLTFNESFTQPYPHKVAMAENLAGLKSIDAEQMVQFCMINPMKTKAYPWNSKELAALTLYVEEVIQPAYIKQQAGE